MSGRDAPGASGCGSGDDGFGHPAGVVGVGVDEVGGEGERSGRAAGEAAGGDGVPVQRGGDLEDEAGERGGAVVAEGEAGADGDCGGGGSEVDVEVVGGEGEGAALGVGDGEGVGLRGRGGIWWEGAEALRVHSGRGRRGPFRAAVWVGGSGRVRGWCGRGAESGAAAQARVRLAQEVMGVRR